MENIGNSNAEEFAQYENLPLKIVLKDSGTGNWQDNWVVDGYRADIRNTPEGMVFSAGPERGDNSCHAVLWSKKSFSGSMKVEFDFTRLDTINRFVNILYFHAQGVGGDYVEDIHSWSDKRCIPFMKTYFENMNLLHISYAAFGNQNDDDDNYLRVRRYPVTEERSFEQIEVEPTIEKTGFFQSGILHKMCFVKTKDRLALRVKTEEAELHHIWDTTTVAPPESGPLGIRHMWTKSSLYKDIKIYSEA
ncbi:MAG: hypothetical protein ACYTFY_13735 [Planctomycetota bacterium]